MPDTDARDTSLFSEFGMALAFLTRLPFLPLPEVPPPGSLAPAMRTFPLAGALIGAVGGGIYALAALVLPGIPSAALALAATALLTGALHEDGLADVADGFGGGADRDRKLSIMRDSRIGAFGMTAVTLALLIRAGTLAGFSPMHGLCVMVAAHALSRAVIPLSMTRLEPARADGLGVSVGRPAPSVAAWAVGLGAAISVLVLSPAVAAAAILGAAIAAHAMAFLAKRQIGGYTGDVLGAIEQAAQTAALVCALAAS